MPRGVSAAPAELPAELYAGTVNSWECDEGGHLNVRFHIERAMTGLALLAAELGMRPSNSGAAATLIPLDLYVRYHNEARGGEGLLMRGGVVDMQDRGAIMGLDTRHRDGRSANALRLTVAHAEPRSLKPFPWPAQARAAAARLACALPEHAKPRSIDLSRTPCEPTRARADELGLVRSGAFVVTPDQCDVFGRLRPEHIAGRVSDSTGNFVAAWRKLLAVDGVETAGAVLESRIVYRRWPRAGDLIEVRSGVAEVQAKTNRYVHWLVDPVSGAAWASVETISLVFDPATRKAMTPTPEALAALRARIAPGLSV
jgi:acyl-CoA thioester hydrolase